MDFPVCTLWVAGFGMLGGVVNALLTDNGFLLPKKKEEAGVGQSIIRPGFLGNCLIGSVSAFIAWGLYSSAASVPVRAASEFHLTPGILATALLVGVSGARWLTNEVDKRLFHAAAAAEAARNGSSSERAQTIALASPAEALRLCSQSGQATTPSLGAPRPNSKPEEGGVSEAIKAAGPRTVGA